MKTEEGDFNLNMLEIFILQFQSICNMLIVMFLYMKNIVRGGDTMMDVCFELNSRTWTETHAAELLASYQKKKKYYLSILVHSFNRRLHYRFALNSIVITSAHRDSCCAQIIFPAFIKCSAVI